MRQALQRRLHWLANLYHRNLPGNLHLLLCQQMQRGACHHHHYDKAQLLKSLSMENGNQGHSKVLVSHPKKSSNESVTTASKQSFGHLKITWWPRSAITIA